jgi:hypothetical protein
MKKRAILVLAFTASTLSLSGCALIGGNYGSDQCDGDQYSSNQFDNSQNDTLFSGKQPGETKRHADDWAGPLLDDVSGN